MAKARKAGKSVITDEAIINKIYLIHRQKVMLDKDLAVMYAVETQDFFVIVAPRVADAQGEPTSEGFVVFKGSKIATSTVPSLFTSFLKLRQSLIDKGIIINNDESLELTDDYIFGSPSTAAAIVMGRNANGQTEWKLPNGRTHRGCESEEEILLSKPVLPKAGLDFETVDN